MSHEFEDLITSKKQIQSKLATTDQKIERLSSILQKKLQLHGITPDEMVATKDGHRVSDYRYHLMSDHLNINTKLKNETLKNKQIGTMLPSLSSYQKTNNEYAIQQKCKNLLKDIESKDLELIRKRKQKEASKLSSIHHVPQSFFPNRYLRGELPCTIEHGANGNFLSWACPLENLEFEYYLPIFFDGLQCKDYPVSFIARQGVEDMLFWARNKDSKKVKKCIKELIRPLRNALSIPDNDIILCALKSIQYLIKANCAIDLVPYLNSLMTPLAKYMDNEVNIGDQIDFSQRKNNCLGEQVRITLELIEEKGGPKALTAIKSAMPTYMSCYI